MNRIAKSLVLAGLLVAVLSVGAAPAMAKKPCWRELINDWYDGRIDKVYPVKCYQQAIDNAPEEAETYTSLPEDLRRALAGAVRTGAKNVGPGAKGRSGTTKQPRGKPSGTKGATAKLDPQTPVPAGGIRSAEPTGGDDSPFGASSADSVPVPLLIMAGLALLLMAAGGAGMISRRMQARRVPVTPPGPQPPA